MACIQGLYSNRTVHGCPEAVLAAARVAAVADVAGANLIAAGHGSEKLVVKQHGMTTKFPADRFSLAIQAVVLGTDTAGRMDEEAFITWWKQTMDSYPIGVTWAMGWVVAMATWPADSRPVPPLGSATVRPVILGNLHDPNTAYASAQQARKLFPQGAIMTWQGYGHCLCANTGWRLLKSTWDRSVAAKRLPKLTNGLGKFLCASKVLGYILTGELPLDGYSCMKASPLAVGPKTAIEQAQDLIDEFVND
eukprot:CAMPEP_0179013488 /NCGR_PEP_ID=MMETSP0796-20121207/1753_1 /TAXON_ID=73915 /ORGANISM="Pyrodinium bahamense, Strain pbaha01" /LENGTH=249 /DNA_ID=CAMNT_0020708995 /DNA_START=30 /DNA_END=779 /DNA_ORIENTATION=-